MLGPVLVRAFFFGRWQKETNIDGFEGLYCASCRISLPKLTTSELQLVEMWWLHRGRPAAPRWEL